MDRDRLPLRNYQKIISPIIQIDIKHMPTPQRRTSILWGAAMGVTEMQQCEIMRRSSARRCAGTGKRLAPLERRTQPVSHSSNSGSDRDRLFSIALRDLEAKATRGEPLDPLRQQRTDPGQEREDARKGDN